MLNFGKFQKNKGEKLIPPYKKIEMSLSQAKE